MPVFISHSFKDEAVYSTLCLALDGSNLARWDPSTMAVGYSLADQLRKAITDCEVCVLIATRSSIESPWCLAEVGAFWGSGKTVIIFLADPDLTESVLPPQFKGNLMAREARDLIAAARSIVESRAKVDTGKHQMEFFASAGALGGDSEWLKLLNDANKSFDIMGVALLSWRQTQGFRETVSNKARNGCKIRILLMHQENPALPQYASDLEMLRVNISRNLEYYQSLADENANIEVRQLRDGLMYSFITRTDQYAVVLQFLSSEEWGKGPVWTCVRDTALYNIALKEFESLWVRAGQKADPTPLELAKP